MTDIRNRTSNINMKYHRYENGTGVVSNISDMNLLKQHFNSDTVVKY